MEHMARPEHIPLTQRKNFCGPTCIQMILARRGFIYSDQEKLAFELGVSIDKKDKTLYRFPFKALSEKDPEVGFKRQHFTSERTKEFFGRFNLDSNFYPINEIEDLKEFIIENFKKNNDIILNFHWRGFDKKAGLYDGHYVLASKYDDESGIITVCDPSPKQAIFWKAPLAQFEEAMKPKWGDKQLRGVVIVWPKKRGFIPTPPYPTRKITLVKTPNH